MHRSNNTLPPPNCRTEATLQLEKKLLISVLLEPGAKLFSFSALRYEQILVQNNYII